MAGWSGTRFWPKSRKAEPKQFLKIGSDKTLIQETVERLDPLIKPENIYLVISRQHLELVHEQLPDVPEENILIEPVGRNTTACIALAAYYISRKDTEGIMCVLPADHKMLDQKAYREKLKVAIEVAAEGDNLVTFGITPEYPETGYGYIEHGEHCFSEISSGVMKVKRFCEKPNADNAWKYYSSGNYFWNSGMFIWSVDAITRAVEKHMPSTADALRPLVKIDQSEIDSFLDETFPTLEPISIDYGVMERADNVYVVEGSFGWSDVGSWRALDKMIKPDDRDNAISGDVVAVESGGNIVIGNKRLITLLHVDDLVIVDTDDALLICPKEKTQDVRQIVDMLKEKGREDLL